MKQMWRLLGKMQMKSLYIIHLLVMPTLLVLLGLWMENGIYGATGAWLVMLQNTQEMALMRYGYYEKALFTLPVTKKQLTNSVIYMSMIAAACGAFPIIVYVAWMRRPLLGLLVFVQLFGFLFLEFLRSLSNKKALTLHDALNGRQLLKLLVGLVEIIIIVFCLQEEISMVQWVIASVAIVVEAVLLPLALRKARRNVPRFFAIR